MREVTIKKRKTFSEFRALLVLCFYLSSSSENNAAFAGIFKQCKDYWCLLASCRECRSQKYYTALYIYFYTI